MASGADARPAGPRPTPVQGRLLGILLASVLALGGLGAAWLAAAGSWSTRASAPSPAARAAFEEETGVRIVRVALTGGGGLVDLRYEVVDAHKAAMTHGAPALVAEESGKVIDALFMDHFHRGHPRAGAAYPLLFVNERGLVERGDDVSVVFGDARLEHVSVR